MRNLAHFVAFPLLALSSISSFATLALANPLGSRSNSSLSRRDPGSDLLADMRNICPANEEDMTLVVNALERANGLFTAYELQNRAAKAQNPDEDAAYKQAHSQFMGWGDKLYKLNDINLKELRLAPKSAIAKLLNGLPNDNYQRFRAIRALHIIILLRRIDSNLNELQLPGTSWSFDPGSFGKAMNCDVYWLARSDPLIDTSHPYANHYERLTKYLRDITRFENGDGCNESLLAPYSAAKEADGEEAGRQGRDRRGIN